MNKSDLVELLAVGGEIPKATAEKALNKLLEGIVDAVAKGDTVSVVGFGSFKSTTRAARTGHNPKTGEAIKIAASVVPKFTAGSKFKEAVNVKKGGKKK